jgi:hypothetical protein
MTAGEINNVTHVVTELRRGGVSGSKLRNHLGDDIALKLSIQNPT